VMTSTDSGASRGACGRREAVVNGASSAKNLKASASSARAAEAPARSKVRKAGAARGRILRFFGRRCGERVIHYIQEVTKTPHPSRVDRGPERSYTARMFESAEV